MQAGLKLAILTLAVNGLTIIQPVSATEPSRLVRVEEASTGLIDSVEQHGHSDRENTIFSVSANKGSQGGAFSVFSASINGRQTEAIRIDNRNFRFIDLSTMQAFVHRDGDQILLKVNFKYGESRADCFTNDDGRNILTILFFNNQPARISDTFYENCEPNVRPVTH